MSNSLENRKQTFGDWLFSDGNRAMNMFTGFIIATSLWGIFAVAPAQRENQSLAAENAALKHCISTGEATNEANLKACLNDHYVAQEAMDERNNR